jgi:hypothetical protein
VKDRTQEQTPSAMPERAPQDGENRALWAWVEPVVWIERMLATLETGIEGGNGQWWPTAYFTAMGLFSLRQAHAVACRSS